MQDGVFMNVTEYRNTYQFSRPINLILPYSLCLGIGLAILALGMYSFHQKEIPVAGGGFLQVMMATKGGARMEELVVQQGLIGADAMSKELRELKIRYGELVVVKETGQPDTRPKYGFGTVEETTQLWKRK